MSILDEICQKKREYIAHRKSLVSFDEIKLRVADSPRPHGFIGPLMMATGPALIAEVKKASPSKGVIRKDYNPATIAKTYENSGASCVSVLTDEPYFQGKDDDLISVRKDIKLPILRKDFMLDPYQIFESRLMGADCILLIMAALEDVQARELYNTALELGLDVLIEVHDLEELERAKKLDPMMIGVNNRNLKTMEVNLSTSVALCPHIPSTAYKISESGIKTHDDIMKLYNIGYRGFLVGESLMAEDNIQMTVFKLLGKA